MNEEKSKLKTIEISIAKDFSPYAAGRYRQDGNFTAQAFREDCLRDAFLNNDIVVIDLDGMFGLSSSFAEEVFGGLIREEKFSKEFILSKLKLTGLHLDDHYRIKKFIQNASKA